MNGDLINAIVQTTVTAQKAANDALRLSKKVNRLTVIGILVTIVGGIALRKAYSKIANLNERLEWEVSSTQENEEE